MNRQVWSDNVWCLVEGIYRKIVDHPFVKELSEGILPREKFEFYLLQDALYLDRYASVLSDIASRLSDKNHMESFLGFAKDGIEVEKSMHSRFLSKQPSGIMEMSPTCLMYVSMLGAQSAAPVEVAAAAVLPCFWIYQKVGEEIMARQTAADCNPYREWIATYSDPVFAESTRRAIEICDELADNTTDGLRKRMTDVFVLCSKMEWLFWDSAYNLEKWKI